MLLLDNRKDKSFSSNGEIYFNDDVGITFDDSDYTDSFDDDDYFSDKSKETPF